ncbi:RRT14 Regulator of rDNA transcription 14 [Candida maltosa Xu316]|uniref:Regulator of rDNA transcription 14 n=1 Tax=Candida maltosa (strain Xu316) TaxID=1245528 RepID=M3III8_CANMX|nr:hypothetical protein G210_3606 [Candida maltosa Xu316]
MSFHSNASKHQAETTISKLFSNILHTEPSSKKNSNKKPISSTQLVSNQFNHHTIKKKKTSNKNINKKVEKEKSFNKFVKYNYIKNKAVKSESDQKYLKKLAKKNINKLNSVSKIDDFEISEEFDQVSSELLDSLKPKGGKRLRKKLLRVRPEDEADNGFEEKIKKGVISYPGLTPGLAPVDYDEEDSE